MDTRTRVAELIRYVEQGRILEAIEEFYGDHVVMQENGQTPTVGRAANLERERSWLAQVQEVHENRAIGVLAEGDRATIHWIFDFTATDGTRLRFDQIAEQTWRDGRIVRERFYYDPATLGMQAAA